MSDQDGISAYQMIMAQAINGLCQLDIEELTSYLDNEGPMAKLYRTGKATRGDLVIELAGRLADAALERKSTRS